MQCGGEIVGMLSADDQAFAVAQSQADGAVAWQNLAFDNAHSSPLLITVDGQPQVVALGLWSVMDGLIRNWMFEPDSFRLVEVGADVVDTVLRGLRAR